MNSYEYAIIIGILAIIFLLGFMLGQKQMCSVDMDKFENIMNEDKPFKIWNWNMSLRTAKNYYTSYSPISRGIVELRLKQVISCE